MEAHTPKAKTPNRTEENKKSEVALREEEVLAFWKERGIFEKTLRQEAPNGEFVFYDGPPFATGLPHTGSLLSSVIKDVVGRYKTMRGYHVRRRWGWDCHGLPIENMIEKKLGLKSKKDILALGIARFNEEARASVLEFADDWKTYVERIGRWVDFDHSYKTMDNTYIESVWWGLQQVHKKGLLYEGRKVLLYCPHCETPLAKAEIAMDNSYKDVTEESLFVLFKIAPEQKIGDWPVPDNTALVAWTTTPWTLPANVALAVGNDITYVVVRTEAYGSLIVAEERAALVEGKVVATVRGSDLVGLSYEPLYSIAKAKEAGSEKAWTVLSADFVTTDEGTGVVHIAPVYGEDDYQLGLANTLPIVPLLDAAGHYTPDAPELVRGLYYKKGGAVVTDDLESRSLVFARQPHTHSYPHCYRCGTALIYNALTSWFINIQKVKQTMLDENEKVNWYPDHLKHGRFQHNVENAPDWTISRNRFWASPLPIWKHERTGEVKVLGSLEEIKAYTKRSGNTYFLMRHGEAQNNVEGIISSQADNQHHLTEKGRAEALAAAQSLKGKGVTTIVASPFVRTRETAHIVAEVLGLREDAVTIDDRLKEFQFGVFNNKPIADYWAFAPTVAERFTTAPEGGETMNDIRRRVGDFLYALESLSQNETILIITHDTPLLCLTAVAQGWSKEKIITEKERAEDFVHTAEVRELDFVMLPHNAEYELDLHRPYIDDLPLVAEDDARLIRIPEVVDCWVESGSMPFAEHHYPFEHVKDFETRYPADFIAEYIAQTRTWFYYTHAIGVLLFNKQAFKNVVTTGNILSDDGSKMSKSKGNYTDPLINMEQFGADALRCYLMGSVVMQAEDTSFRDHELREVHNRVINILWNSYKFYTLFAGEVKEAGGILGKRQGKTRSKNILDRWVLARLHDVVVEVTTHMDAYDTVRAVRVLRDFITDLSTWYIRRSRDRLRVGESKDKAVALATMEEVFALLAKLLAPLMPFISESMYGSLGRTEESVHLAPWPLPDATVADPQLLIDMNEVRRIVSLALEARSRSGIKVRQPLSLLTIRSGALKKKTELLALIAEEINVSRVMVDETMKEEVLLDTDITPELRDEGMFRELVRLVQDLRKRSELVPTDRITLTVYASDEIRALLHTHAKALEATAGVQQVVYVAEPVGETLTIEGVTFSVTLEKV